MAIDSSSVKIKVLGVFLGPLDLEEDNWRPRLSAVENVLLSWHQRALSFRGKALVINALALSRIWYVASLIHMPSWVLRELNSLVFKFFWKGKPDLVSRAVVVEPNCCGGFSVVDVNLKVSALLLQWIRRFASSPNSWVSFLVYWFNLRLGLSPVKVFANTPVFDVNLPPFYVSLLHAWRLAAGSASPSGVLCVGRGVVCGGSIPPVSFCTGVLPRFCMNGTRLCCLAALHHPTGGWPFILNTKNLDRFVADEYDDTCMFLFEDGDEQGGIETFHY